MKSSFTILRSRQMAFCYHAIGRGSIEAGSTTGEFYRMIAGLSAALLRFSANAFCRSVVRAGRGHQDAAYPLALAAGVHSRAMAAIFREAQIARTD
jgi:hypothetical protein